MTLKSTTNRLIRITQTATFLALAGMIYMSAIPAKADTPVSAAPRPFAAHDLAFTAKKSAVMWWDGKTTATVYWEYHMPPDLWRIEFLAPADAKGRVMIQRGSTVWQWEPKAEKIFVTTGDIMEGSSDRVDPLLTRNYELEVVSSTQKEAGFPCRVLKVTPRHSGKSKWLLSVDQHSGLILKRERFGEQGNLEMTAQTLAFKPGPVDPYKFDPKKLPSGKVVNRKWVRRTLSRGRAEDIMGIYPPSELRGGFRLRSLSVVKKDPDTVQLIYSDGLVALSLFGSVGSTPSKADMARGHEVKIGNATGMASTYGHLASVTWKKAKFRYTLVGGMSERGLLRIARSLADD